MPQRRDVHRRRAKGPLLSALGPTGRDGVDMRWITLALSPALALLLSTAAQAFPSQYANVLQKAQYTIRIGDYNSDGHLDLLLIPKRQFVIIDFDPPFPVIPKPASPPFVLLSSGSSYTLTANPSSAVLTSSVWQASSYALTFGDTLGTGSVNLLLQGPASGNPSFLIATSSSDGQPTLLENLSVSSIGVDLSAATTVSSLQDVNWDGRADLVVYTNGKLNTALIAAADGTFAPPPQSSGGSALSAWRAFCAAITLGDAPSATNMLSGDALSVFTDALSALGQQSSMTTVTQQWSEPIAIISAPDFATFAVTQPEEGGVLKMHLVTLILESNRWVVYSF
jgi:hypothetical protein